MTETSGQLANRKDKWKRDCNKDRSTMSGCQGRGERVPNLSRGDVVLMKNRHPGGKFKTTFESGLWTVTRVKGTLVTVTRGNDIVTRNIYVSRHITEITRIVKGAEMIGVKREKTKNSGDQVPPLRTG
ncbi:hypothetical protein NDU88_001206 [Pleurodeles waltl]|uniref:Uncharacterized protein n=1 Tax=Pleurodeles waltl TaxID=8319 RepID=A0AAV7KSU8_PLEWA|nr:hypothetical protein NDU88_001206 [Pleurodeles waltl]